MPKPELGLIPFLSPEPRPSGFLNFFMTSRFGWIKNLAQKRHENNVLKFRMEEDRAINQSAVFLVQVQKLASLCTTLSLKSSGKDFSQCLNTIGLPLLRTLDKQMTAERAKFSSVERMLTQAADIIRRIKAIAVAKSEPCYPHPARIYRMPAHYPLVTDIYGAVEVSSPMKNTTLSFKRR